LYLEKELPLIKKCTINILPEYSYRHVCACAYCLSAIIESDLNAHMKSSVVSLLFDGSTNIAREKQLFCMAIM